MRHLVLASLLAGCSTESKPKDEPTPEPATRETEQAGRVAAASSRVGTQDQRLQLFDELMDKTRRREAFSELKNERLGLDYDAAAKRLRPLFAKASTDGELFYALVQLSNARRDRHLKVKTVAGGLEVPEAGQPPREAPVKFLPSYGSETIFVADVAKDLPEPRPGLGDRVLEVNGKPIDVWLDDHEQWFRFSTIDNLRWQQAAYLNRDRYGLGPPHVLDVMRLKLLSSRDNQPYETELGYEEAKSITWEGNADPHYTGFEEAVGTGSATLFVPSDDRPIVVFQWHGFRPSLPADLDTLMAYAQRHALLDHDVIVDTTYGRGGAGSAWALARLSPKRFKGTFGNVRNSDVVPGFLKLVKAPVWDEPKEHGVVEWLEVDVLQNTPMGDYAKPVPFKSFHLPKDSDGVFDPAPVHFRGRLACIFGPRGGSNLDQFGAMVVDNDLGFTVGLPLGGYSNTWEWTETLYLPGSQQPLASYMWNIGHTIRPNGEVLEGNPAVPAERLPLTAENFRDYHDQAIARIVAHWAGD